MELLVFKLQGFGNPPVTVDFAQGMEPRPPAPEAEREKSIDKNGDEDGEVSLKKIRTKNEKGAP